VQDATKEDPASGSRSTGPIADPVASPSATLRALRDSGPPIVLVDGTGRVVLASAAANALWSRSPEGLQLTDLFDDANAHDLEDAVRVGSYWSGNVTTDDDVRRTLECTCTPLTDAAAIGAVSCLSLVDRTDELNRIADLEAANRRSLALLDAMPDLLFRISSDLTFLDYRDPTTRGIDVPPDQFLGKRLDAFLPPRS
jgi:PAS domain-containing protein